MNNYIVFSQYIGIYALEALNYLYHQISIKLKSLNGKVFYFYVYCNNEIDHNKMSGMILDYLYLN